MGGARCSGVGAWQPSAMPFIDRRRGVDSFQYSVSGKRAGANRRRQKSRRLQWSPTSSGRETWRARTETTCWCARFNGALPIQAGKPVRVKCSFNGALPIQAGKRAERARWRLIHWSFNGALPIQAGKLANERFDMLVAASASMEPYPFRQGNMSRRASAASSARMLQWSPTHSGRETW